MASYFEQPCEIFLFMTLQLGNFRRRNSKHTWFPQPAEIWSPSFASLVLEASSSPPSLSLPSFCPSILPSFSPSLPPGWEEPAYLHWVWMMVASVLETSHKTDGMPSSCPRSPLATGIPDMPGAHFSAGFQRPLKPIESAQGRAYFLQMLILRLHYYLSSTLSRHGRL